MKLILAGLALAAAPVLVSTASADHRRHAFRYADTLAKDCQSDVPALRGMCLGYLAAMSDAVEDAQDKGSQSRRVCDPATVSLEDYRLALLGYLKDNPQQLKRPSSEVVTEAFSARWPCRKD